MSSARSWYPVGFSRDLEAGTSMGTQLLGLEIVVWRDEDGAAHVWEDRCPHRGMRLSFGFVRGNHIACLYHGWQYDTEGQCRYIPAHPRIEVPAVIKATRFASVEHAGLIWARSDTQVTAAPLETAAELEPVRSLYLECSADDVLAELSGAGLLAQEPPGVLLTLAFGERVLLAGLQPMNEAKAALHLAIPARTRDNGLLHEIADWSERLRERLEHTAAVRAASAQPQRLAP